MRRLVGVLIGASVALLGAEILKEYEFKGFAGAISGFLFGLFVAEVVVAVSGERSTFTAVSCGVLAYGGLLWAIWHSAGLGHKNHGPIPGGGWWALVLGTAVAVFRSRSPGRTAPSSPPQT